MRQKRKTPAGAWRGSLELDQAGGFITFHNRRISPELQAREVEKRVSVSPAVARVIAALAFETKEASR